jgi:hypothetical protein
MHKLSVRPIINYVLGVADRFISEKAEKNAQRVLPGVCRMLTVFQRSLVLIVFELVEQRRARY